MADFALTAADIRPALDQGAEIVDYVCGVTITKGQVVYVVAAGTLALADANDAGLLQAIGIALHNGVAGDSISVMKKGYLYGYTITQDRGTHVWLSNTVGKLADAAGGVAQPVGRIANLPDKPNYTKIMYVEFGWSTLYA